MKKKPALEPHFRLEFILIKFSNVLIMKTRPQLLFLAGAAALALGACATIGLKRGCVSFNEAYIEIYPGTNISPQDEARLYRILRQYNSSLYKIRKTDNSQMTTHGSLQDVYIKQDL